MNFAIITHVPHKKLQSQFLAYAPYVREMNLWLKHVDEVEVVAPFDNSAVSKIDMAYQHTNLVFSEVPSIEFTSLKCAFQSFIKLPIIFLRIFKACKKADHIHLRCPGNMGLLGCIVQIFFPKKLKTAKYAGNWDPKAKQPLSYKLQKWLLSNTFLTKNMQVLVYGEWYNQTKNIKPFFTASFSNSNIETPLERDYSKEITFIFVGSLVAGKRPLETIQVIEGLQNAGKNVRLDMYGDGILKADLQEYISKKQLQNFIKIHGNQDSNVIKKALKSAHFLMLLSKSEGWPKAVAEAMFFGTIPIATSVSCVSNMLQQGERGILVNADVNQIVQSINSWLQKEEALKTMSRLASQWSQKYTLEVFEADIYKLLKQA